MKRLKLQLTDTYTLHFTVTDWQDTKTVMVESQWSGAKNPDVLQTRFQVTLSKENLKELSKFLSES